MSFTLICDTETNGIKPTKVHCLVVKCLEINETFVFADEEGYSPISEGLILLQEAECIIGHNVLDYDLYHLERLYPHFKVDKSKVLDTLTLARKYFPDLQGHRLKDWGIRLGMLKGNFSENADWSKFSKEMLDYCIRDVDVTTFLYEVLLEAAME